MSQFRTIASAICLLGLTCLGCEQTTAPVGPHGQQMMPMERKDIPNQAPRGFQVRVIIEPRKVVAGSTPAVYLEISNHGPRAVLVGGGFSCLDYGYVARDEKGNTVTDSWTGVDCIGGFQWPWVIQPGESFTVEAPTIQNLFYLQPGRYWIEGKILSGSAAITPPTLLTIVASDENEAMSRMKQPSRTQ